MDYKKSNQGWLSVASNITTEKINCSKKSKRKSKSIVYNISDVGENKSVIKSSFISSTFDDNKFLDTSNYRQTNISSFLKRKRKKLNKKKSAINHDDQKQQNCDSLLTIQDTSKGIVKGYLDIFFQFYFLVHFEN